MEFQSVDVDGTSEAPGLFSRLVLDPMSLIQMGILAVVALILGMFVVRPILASRPEPAAALPAPAGLPDLAPDGEPETQMGADVLTGEIDDGNEPMSAMPMLGEDDLGDIMPVAGFQYEEDPVDRLRQMIQDRREETVEILRGWIDDEEKEETV